MGDPGCFIIAILFEIIATFFEWNKRLVANLPNAKFVKGANPLIKGTKPLVANIQSGKYYITPGT